jgi:hypothetical protein
MLPRLSLGEYGVMSVVLLSLHDHRLNTVSTDNRLLDGRINLWSVVSS